MYGPIVAIGAVSRAGVRLLGTGFAVGTNSIATAAHVVGTTNEQLVVVLVSISSLNEYQDTANNRVEYVYARMKCFNPMKDIAILEIDKALDHFHTLESTDEAPTGTELILLSYPHADYGRLVLTQHKAAVGARIILASNGVKSKHIVMNIHARPGQSGGAILLPQNKSVVAMLIGSYVPRGIGNVIVSGIDPLTLHQTTHAISAEYIQEMIK